MANSQDRMDRVRERAERIERAKSGKDLAGRVRSDSLSYSKEKKALQDTESELEKVRKEIKKIYDAKYKGRKYDEDALNDLKKQRKSLKENIKLQKQSLSNYSEESKKLGDIIREHENKVSVIRRENETKAMSAVTDRELLQNIINQTTAENELYNLERENESLKQRALQKQLELQRNIFDSQQSTEEQRDEAIRQYSELLDKQKELTKEQEKQNRDFSRRVAVENVTKKRGKTAGEETKSVLGGISNLFSSGFGIFNMLRGGGLSPLQALLGIKDVVKETGESIKVGNKDLKLNLETFTKTISKGLSSLNKIIDSAAKTISSTYSSVSASLSGSNKTFESIYDELVGGAGISTLVEQKDLLTQVQQIASQGISTDIESIAVLTAIRDKTVHAFNTTDHSLRRLILLNQNRGNLTAKQFGLASVLRDELNAAFGDSSYLGSMFQQLTGTLLDAVSANSMKGGTDSTNFYSVIEHWAAGMYESGVDQGTINSITQGINYLGSGNINALSGNKSLQNLLLLSMDRAGLDYSQILQRGLSASDANKLLSEIISYLADITDNTKQNNVLQSSYANLFNLSITDMAAIKNLSQNKSYIDIANRSLQITNSVASQLAEAEINNVSDRVLISEKIDNAFENLKFITGASIAQNEVAYGANLAARMGIELGTTLADFGLTKIGGGLALASGLVYAGSMLPAVKDLISAVGGGLKTLGTGENTLAHFISNNLTTGGAYDASVSTSASISTDTQTTNEFKKFDYKSKSESYSMADTTQWENDQKAANEQQSEEVKILKEFEKTLMKQKEGEGYAFAVSLQGMSDGVLRSFASIFADEDAMMQTLKGKNNALEKNNTFIDYATDTSTKSTKSNATKNKGTTLSPEFTP